MWLAFFMPEFSFKEVNAMLSVKNNININDTAWFTVILWSDNARSVITELLIKP